MTPSRISLGGEPVTLAARARITPAVRFKLAERQNGLCAMCGEPLPPGFHVDHRIPLALGGDDAESNYQALDWTCHAKKTARDLADIARAKRRAFKNAGGKKPGAGRLKGRGFAKWSPPDFSEARSGSGVNNPLPDPE